MHKVTLSNGKTFMSSPESTLLEAAKSNDIVLEHSCRTGRCGVCKARVLSGETIMLLHEEGLLEEEKNNGYILTCCRGALSDVKLDIEDVGRFADIKSKVLPTRIDEITLLTPDIMRVILRLPPNTEFKYLAGQYIDVIGKGGVRRSYSVANAQCHDSRIELQIRKIDGGTMSRYWFGEAKNNDLLRIEGPLGTFSNRLVHVENMIFLATGTGIAPVKAMLEEMTENHKVICSQSIYLYWGGRKEADIYWEPALSIPNLNFIPVLSQPGSDWYGRTGYVQHVLLEDRLDLGNSVVYACGSNEMILNAREMLLEQGLKPGKFYSDAFVSSC